jgi:hypothetical protein
MPTTMPTTMPLVPSPFTTTLVAVIVVFLGLATIALGLRIYCARISSPRDRWWLTTDLMLIIASLIVTCGCILTTIIGAATIGLDYTNNKMNPVEGAQFLFKVCFKTNTTNT